jgi:LysM repeat protein
MIKLLIIGLSFFNPQIQRDSIGVETINGKVFVIHKVGEKETLYGISKRYGTTVDAVLQYNPTASSGLEIGQILKVPYVAKTVNRTQTSGGGITHVVAEKETLFSIAKAYGVTVDELKQWNSLTSNALLLGQELAIRKRNTNSNVTTVQTTPVQQNNANEIKSKKGAHTVAAKETMFSIARQYGITVQQLKDWNNLQTNELSIGQVLFVSQPEQGLTVARQDNAQIITENQTRQNENQQQVVKETKVPESQPVKEKETVKPKEPTITISEAVRGSDEVSESGLAELIEGTDGNRKYLALHRTAPIGTILKVKNEMNNREVFVRVMGKLPDTSMTDKLVIRVSKSAYDRLGAIDQRFRVQVTYYK